MYYYHTDNLRLRPFIYYMLLVCGQLTDNTRFAVESRVPQNFTTELQKDGKIVIDF